MTTAIAGQRAGNMIVPLSNMTKRSKQVSITVTGENWETTRAVAIFYADSSNNWRMKFSAKGTISPTTTNITLTIANILSKNVSGFYQAITVWWGTNATMRAEIHPNSNTITADVGTSDGNLSLHGDIELDSEPLTYTIPANMEASASADVYIEPASEGVSGLVSTTSQTFAGDKTFAGSISGRGTLPLGAIIPIHDVGSNVTVPVTGVINDSGFQFCDGAVLGSGHGLGTGITNAPDLTGNRFLMGTTIAGTAGTLGGNSGNTVQLSSSNLPTHVHSISHGHTLSGGVTSSGSHSHTSSWQYATGGGSIYTNNYIPPHNNSGSDAFGSIGTGSSGAHTHTDNFSVDSHSGDSGNGGFSNTAFDIRPLYMTVKYVMRVK